MVPCCFDCHCGKSCRLMSMLSMTFTFFIVEIVVGYLTKSMALVADSFHMLSDVLALIIAFSCMKIAKRRSKKNTFGWVRAEILGALVNAVFLLALCFSIFVEAIKRLVEPEAIEEPKLILVVGLLGLLVNIVGMFLFHGHASLSGHGHSHGKADEVADVEINPKLRESFSIVQEAHNISVLNGDYISTSRSSILNDSNVDEINEERQALTNERPPESVVVSPSKPAPKSKSHSHEAGQLNMHGVFLHILGDLIGSLIVCINASLIWLTDSTTLASYLDPSLSLCMVLLICFTTIPLLRESALILLQTTPKYMNIDSMKKKLLDIPGVLAVHELHIWRLAGSKIIATVHVRFRNVHDYMAAADMMKSVFHDEHIHSTTIQPEFVEMADNLNQTCLLRCPPAAGCDRLALCCPESVKGQPRLSSIDSDTGVQIRNRQQAAAQKITDLEMGTGKSASVDINRTTQNESIYNTPEASYTDKGNDATVE